MLAGPKPYEELPLWARAFDAAIYPHRVNRQVKHSNPLKLREYLATGKPIVAVTTPETARFSGVVALADNPEAFLSALDGALANDTPADAKRRMDAVRGTSWDARFQETVEVVERLLRFAALDPAAQFVPENSYPFVQGIGIGVDGPETGDQEVPGPGQLEGAVGARCGGDLNPCRRKQPSARGM